MKLIGIGLFICALAFAGDDASKAPPPAPAMVAAKPATPDMPLDELTSTKLRRIEAERMYLEEKYRLAQYNQEIASDIAELNQIILDRCKELGATAEDVNASRCGVDWKTKFPEEKFKFGKVMFMPLPSAAPASPPAPVTKPEQK